MIHLAMDKHVVGSCKHGNRASGLSNYAYCVYYHLNHPTSAAIPSIPQIMTGSNGKPYSVVRAMPTHTDRIVICVISRPWLACRVGNNGAACLIHAAC